MEWRWVPAPVGLGWPIAALPQPARHPSDPPQFPRGRRDKGKAAPGTRYVSVLLGVGTDDPFVEKTDISLYSCGCSVQVLSLHIVDQEVKEK